ncbi:MAG: hemolysin family protein [Kiritimatiellae bacterium]|nr:hemolysin family protein [Kiritimatiellia bacterium]
MAASIAILAVLFCLSAFFSGAETILFSLTGAQRARIRARSAKADARIARCVGDSAMLLSTLLVGNTLANFAIATLGYFVFDALLPRWGGLLAVPVMTVLLLVFGEITPKRLALAYAERLAPACARGLWFWRTLLAPFNIAFRFTARAFSEALVRERRALSDAELVSVLESAAERGEFAQDDAEMIEGVLRLSELHANDEMTPRVDIEGIDSTRPAEPPDPSRRRHRLLPVYRRTPDFIESVLDTKTGRSEDPLFVPEQVTLDDLLVTLRKAKRSMAVVTDEYGGTAGIITVNDIMEIVLGPSVFGGDDPEPAITRISRRVWEIDARASLDEVNRELGVELEAEDSDRLAGWIASVAERIPHVGQTIEAQGCRATVLKKKKRRVVSVRVEVLKYPETDTDAELLAETDEAVEKTEEDNQ